MPCFSPLKGWKARGGGICFSRRLSPTGALMTVPCGQCYGCRREKARQWAVRVMHESSLQARNSFLTLTYEEDPLSLDVDDLQRFFKRVRKHGMSLRYYACGEYGEKLGRPHFHVCMFGQDFRGDAEPWSDGLWISPRLEELWGHGHCVAGELTFESAAYVAGYVMKKITGDAASEHYFRVREDTGEVVFVRPEFAVMSRRPGIGHGWFEEFRPEVVRDDSVISRGFEQKPPRYYDSLLARVDARAHAAIKDRRRKLALSRASENSDERLVVREAVARARGSLQRRSYEG